MRNILALTLVSTLLAPLPALAAGGMGDPSTNLKEHNAICEAQKRGEGPLHPNLCLPEYPPAPELGSDRRRSK